MLRAGRTSASLRAGSPAASATRAQAHPTAVAPIRPKGWKRLVRLVNPSRRPWLQRKFDLGRAADQHFSVLVGQAQLYLYQRHPPGRFRLLIDDLGIEIR